jgi:hypothetical protein
LLSSGGTGMPGPVLLRFRCLIGRAPHRTIVSMIYTESKYKHNSSPPPHDLRFPPPSPMSCTSLPRRVKGKETKDSTVPHKIYVPAPFESMRFYMHGRFFSGLLLTLLIHLFASAQPHTENKQGGDAAADKHNAAANSAQEPLCQTDAQGLVSGVSARTCSLLFLPSRCCGRNSYVYYSRMCDWNWIQVLRMRRSGGI